MTFKVYTNSGYGISLAVEIAGPLNAQLFPFGSAIQFVFSDEKKAKQALSYIMGNLPVEAKIEDIFQF